MPNKKFESEDALKAYLSETANKELAEYADKLWAYRVQSTEQLSWLGEDDMAAWRRIAKEVAEAKKNGIEPSNKDAAQAALAALSNMEVKTIAQAGKEYKSAEQTSLAQETAGKVPTVPVKETVPEVSVNTAKMSVKILQNDGKYSEPETWFVGSRISKWELQQLNVVGNGKYKGMEITHYATAPPNTSPTTGDYTASESKAIAVPSGHDLWLKVNKVQEAPKAETVPKEVKDKDVKKRSGGFWSVFGKTPETLEKTKAESSTTTTTKAKTVNTESKDTKSSRDADTVKAEAKRKESPKEAATASTTGGKPKKSSSFIGRQANTTVGVHSASNYGASRTFVFGSDPSNYSNPAGGGSNHGAPQHQQQAGGDSKAAAGAGSGAVGPASFAGLGNLIAEAKGAAAGKGGSSRGAGGGAGSEGANSMLHSKSGSRTAAPASNVITAAVGTKLAGADRRQNSGGARLFE